MKRTQKPRGAKDLPRASSVPKAFVPLNVVVVTNEPFPMGMAATNRIISHSRGLVELGHRVKVVCLVPRDNWRTVIRNIEPHGSYLGIEFVYSSGTTVWPKWKHQKLYVMLKGIVRAAVQLMRDGAHGAKKTLLLVSNNPIDILFFWIVAQLLRWKYVQEKSEYPFVLRKRGLLAKTYAHFYVNCLYKVFDGMVVMTDALSQYFKPKMRRSAKQIVVPMTVEPERFSTHGNSPNAGEKYIAYCGYMGGNKDGVPILIKAFGSIAKKHPEVKLYLIGDTANAQESMNLEELVSSLSLTQRVDFLGRISRDQIPPILCAAEALALARPSSLQSQGGFPTKLGEYLAAGKPVVVTKVGEIPRYLEDRKTAFLAEPDSVESFAEKMDEVLTDPQSGRRIGLAGRELAWTVFNYRVQALRLAEFLQAL